MANRNTNNMEVTCCMDVNCGYATTQDVRGPASLHIKVDFTCQLDFD